MAILIGICIVVAIWLYYRVTDNKPAGENQDLYDVLDDENATVGSVIKAIDNRLVNNTKHLIRELKDLHEEQKDLPPTAVTDVGKGIMSAVLMIFVVLATVGGFFAGLAWLSVKFAESRGH